MSEMKTMTKEDIDELVEEHERIACSSGFETYEVLRIFQCDAAEGMIRFGGSFTNSLGHALAHADVGNAAKLINAFREMCLEHAASHRKWLENRKVKVKDE